MSDDKKVPAKFPQKMALPDGTVFTAYGVVTTNAPPPLKPMGTRATVRIQPTVATVPNWREWGNMPNVEVWQACALSLNINPHSLKKCEDWESDTRDGFPYFRDASFPSKTISEEFYLRRRVLIANLRKNPEWFTYNSLSAAGNSSLSTSEFAAWAVSKMDWPDLPPELVALARKRVDAPERNDAAVSAGNGAPVKVGAGEMATGDDWTTKAKAIADRIALEQYNNAIRQITARSICGAVAEELAKDETTWGLQGPRSSSNVRTDGLRHWKFTPPKDTK